MTYYNIMETAQRIRALRLARGLTQAQAAERLGVGSGFLSRVERGVCGCSVTLLIRLGQEYGVSTDYLLRGPCRGGFLSREAVVKIIWLLMELLGMQPGEMDPEQWARWSKDWAQRCLEEKDK